MLMECLQKPKFAQEHTRGEAGELLHWVVLASELVNINFI